MERPVRITDVILSASLCFWRFLLIRNIRKHSMDVDLDGLFGQNSTYDYDSDYVYDEGFDQSSKKSVWIPVLYSLVFPVGLLGNLLLLVVLAQRRRAWRTSDTFILHLSISDILLLVTLPFRAAEAAGWCTTALCKICGAIFNMNFLCGMFLLVCIGLDHFLSMVHSIQLFPPSKRLRVHLSCLCVWLLSLLLVIPDWIYLVSEEDHVHQKTRCAYSSVGTLRLFHHVVGFVLPAVLLMMCCSSVLLKLRCNLKSLQEQKSTLLIFPLVGLFFLCWMPYNITLIADTVTHNPKQTVPNKSLKAALTVTAVIGCIHAGLRPLLYLGLCDNFRKRALATLKCTTTESKGSLWEMGMGEEVLDQQNPTAEELKPMTNLEHQTVSAQC
ncbi:C-X-C chemokine receptor type 3-like [Gouania willdenowi]|uniref:C-X-C chemokine receptor type 3-like n=1 Tax=Gouania willdenowi TaxID=441366 RepID=A0A8C5ECT3_GOUWI|nr:C-X-C chemokine receptor type 3-like [Gouania willdenowi]